MFYDEPAEGRRRVLIGFFEPFHRVIEGSLHIGIQQFIVVKGAFKQLLEVASRPFLPLCKGGLVDSVVVEMLLELLGRLHEFFACVITYCTKTSGEVFEKVTLSKQTVEFLVFVLIDVLKDVLAKFLHLTDNVPRLVVFDIFANEAENPPQFYAAGR